MLSQERVSLGTGRQPQRLIFRGGQGGGQRRIRRPNFENLHTASVHGGRFGSAAVDQTAWPRITMALSALRNYTLEFMAIRRAVLVIADIGGYTAYMNWNRTHLVHAQMAVATLLESVIDAAKGMKLAKLEGDAAFFWAPNGDAQTLVSDRLARMHQAFLDRRARIENSRMCNCASCKQLMNLSLKFVAHQGEVAEQKVKRHTELAGVDVILVHRMLKNQVPVPEYVLMTDAVAQCLDEPVRRTCLPLLHDFEGLGETSTYYLDLANSALPPPAAAMGWAGRMKFRWNALPFMVGAKEPCAGFRSLGRGAPELSKG